MNKIVQCAVLMLAFEGHATAQPVDSYAQLADVTWSAFECSLLALSMGMDSKKEADRLFVAGLQSGRKFFQAHHAGKFTANSFKPDSTAYALVVNYVVSPDFALGNAYAAAQRFTSDAIAGGERLPDSAKNAAATAQYDAKRCRLIGVS
jgi:hypothetical protein